MTSPKPAKHTYHIEEDSFYAVPLVREYDSSDQIGDIIFDMDKKGRIVGIEILEASKVLGVPKEALRNIVKMQITIEVSSEKIMLHIQLQAKMRNTVRDVNFVWNEIKPDFLTPSKLDLAIA